MCNSEQEFGKVASVTISKYLIESKNLKVKVLNYGATICEIIYYKNEKMPISVALNYPSFNDYLSQKAYYGAIIGRYANRIGGAKFSLNGKEYNLSSNENGNTLHGGQSGFDKQIWQVEKHEKNAITLSYYSKDGEQGFPSNVKVYVTYTITEDNLLKIDYLAKSDGDTYINLTNHTYFNLNGIENKVDGCLLHIDAEKVTKTNTALIPNGEYILVKGTPYDFNSESEFIKDLSGDETLKIRGCIDDNYVLNGDSFRKVAHLYSPKTKLKMEVYTDQKGMQVYTGNRYGIALETQNFPNAMNVKGFPSPLLKGGEEYKTSTVYKFFIKE
jgi:aldose 1-epimerase